MNSVAILYSYELVLALLIFFFQVGPQPPFKPQEQGSSGLESQMDPKPDFGYISYNSTDKKLQGKVAILLPGKAISSFIYLKVLLFVHYRR
jgi:hypothetical protein